MKNILSKNMGIIAYIILTIITGYGIYIEAFCWKGETCQGIFDFGGISAWIGYASVLLSLVWLYITAKFFINKLWKRN